MIGISKEEQQLFNLLEIGGVYEHYKSTPAKEMQYRVLGVVRNTETEQLMVVYEALYDCGDYGQMWVRPLDMFLQEVEVEGKKIPRFTLIAKSDCDEDCDTGSCC